MLEKKVNICHYLRPWRFGGQRSRKRDPQIAPSRGSWRGRTRAGWREAPRRPRKRRSWLDNKVQKNTFGMLGTSYRPTGRGDGLLGKCLNDDGLVALGVDELVVDDLDARVVAGQQDDLVGDGLGLGEGGDVLADAGEAEDDVLGVGALQLGLGLLAEDDEVEVGVLEGPAADETAETRVDTAAEALVGAADDDQLLLALGLERLRLGRVEDGVGGLAVHARVLHRPLRAVELRRRNDLHRLGDLLDVADGLQPTLDFSERREVGGSRGDGSVLVFNQSVST